ncbi:hypothetical protein AVEN_207827-1 [Araneus ventricosus]|uniref:Uncharacterized protein n=1 Tax=Araneus ventricosus TaxID=182803 RepID=A0A4Y2BWV3_ARAVE|nr:hypothetical protein AVEN_207827-1 [Araneus ventricosus]
MDIDIPERNPSRQKPSGKNCRHDSTPLSTEAQPHLVLPPYQVATFYRRGPQVPTRTKPRRTHVGSGVTSTTTTTNQDPNQSILRRRQSASPAFYSTAENTKHINK